MERREDRVALIEFIERDGRVGRSADVWRWPLTLGRALGNDVVLDDPHVGAHHARLAPDNEGRLWLTALPTRNGVLLDGQRVAGATPVPPAGAQLQLGATRLRLRLRGETLAAERVLLAAPVARLSPLLLQAAALLAVLLANLWLRLDPGADIAAWMPLLAGVPVVLAGWCGLWALLSKLFQHRFDFGGHLRIALPWLLTMAVVDQAWPLLTAALALPGLWMAGGALESLLFAGLLHAHLRHTLPQHRRAVATSVALMAVAAATMSTTQTWRAHDRLVATPYMSTLPPPALRLSGSVPSATLVQELAPLAEKLAQRVQLARQDEAEGEGSE